jgi:hypothetical protein
LVRPLTTHTSISPSTTSNPTLIMAAKSVQSLVEDIRLLSETNFEIVEAVRAAVKKSIPGTTEEVKYGGILFSSGVQFCGVFAYTAHVSVEFGSGAKIKDDFGHLEGSGKGRRHLKFTSLADIKNKMLAQYVPLAHAAASCLTRSTADHPLGIRFENPGLLPLRLAAGRTGSCPRESHERPCRCSL